MRRSLLRGVCFLAALAGSVDSIANPGNPVAIRWWGQGMVSIETYWDLQIVIDPYAPNIGYGDPEISADLVLITHEHPDHNHEQLIRGEPVVVHGLEDGNLVRPVRHVLDRFPNEEQPTWQAVDASNKRSGHEVTVSTVPAWHDDEGGGDRGPVAMFVVEVDGVRIVHCGDLGQSKLRDDQLKALGQVDVLLLPVGGIYTLDGPQAAAIIEQVKPRFAIPLHYKTQALRFNLHGVEPFTEAVQERFNVERVDHNTFAVSSAKPDQGTETQVVVLDYKPWKPAGELAELIERMETACRDSQAVFEPLSTNQMNFRPSNGTHTPRWNTEHMMGRELLFFTQIYNAREPSIAVIDLNPAQMPPDYRAAHPDWSGAEEARQMERTSALVRRFAYLLDGIDLDERAPGSRWTLRRLLAQMERHYGEHTANVKKKFELEDWPTE